MQPTVSHRDRLSIRERSLLAFFAFLVTLAAIVGLLLVFKGEPSSLPIAAQVSAVPDEPDTAHISILQLNDIYELEAVQGGQYGGLARVKTVLNELKIKNPNTLSALAGDLYNPSALGRAKVEGKRLLGEQIVDVFNRIGLDYFTFGNHEFDLDEGPFRERLKESKFLTISSNVVDRAGRMFSNVTGPEPTIREIDGIKLGLAGLCMQTPASSKSDYFQILPPLEAARAAVKALKAQGADIIVLITHQSMSDDKILAASVDGIDLIIGGHEHEHDYVRAGPNLVPIAKADANSRTVFIHDIYHNRKTGATQVVSNLRYIDQSIAEDPQIKQRIAYWKRKAFADLKLGAFGPDDVLATPTVDLDGTEKTIRNESSALTELITQALYDAYQLSGDSSKNADAAILNGGSIRIDEVLPKDQPITGYDVLRISPFGGDICLVSIPGSTLAEALSIGLTKKQVGSFLHYYNIENIGSLSKPEWKVGGELLKANPAKRYNIALPAYLVDVGDQGLDLLKLTAGKGVTEITNESNPKRLPVTDTIAKAMAETYPARK